MSAFLPQQENALFKLLRWMSLGRNKRDYRYNYEHVADLAILDKLPISDEPKPAWVAKVASRIEHVVKNQIQIAKDRRSELDETHKSWSLSEIEKLGSSFKKLVYDTAHYKLRSTSKIGRAHV